MPIASDLWDREAMQNGSFCEVATCKIAVSTLGFVSKIHCVCYGDVN
jgi:hypothetical protein